MKVGADDVRVSERQPIEVVAAPHLLALSRHAGSDTLLKLVVGRTSVRTAAGILHIAFSKTEIRVDIAPVDRLAYRNCLCDITRQQALCDQISRQSVLSCLCFAS
jgi:hypothetical protein